MASQQIFGAWSSSDATSGPGGTVFTDSPVSGGGTGAGGKSLGLIRVSQVSPLPSLMETWSLLGWGINAALLFNAMTTPYFGTMGKLWAGLAVDSQQSSQGGVNSALSILPGRAQFPVDISTFETIWTQDDDIAVAALNAVPLKSVVPSLIAKTFMFPSPVTARAGAQLQMQLILNPSVYGWSNQLVCAAANWSLIYDDGSDK